MVRGVHDLYYSRSPPPFLDKFNPTRDEINAWSPIIINHIRALLGINIPFQLDARLMLETQWADEMNWTNVWDAKYGSQCPSDSKPPPHCGAKFTPDPADRAKAIACPPYNSDFIKYPELENYTTQRVSGAENGGATGTQIPWSLRHASVMVNHICTEGWSGHAGPYLSRRFGGFHWSCRKGGQIDDGGVGVRGKWFG